MEAELVGWREGQRRAGPERTASFRLSPALLQIYAAPSQANDPSYKPLDCESRNGNSY